MRPKFLLLVFPIVAAPFLFESGWYTSNKPSKLASKDAVLSNLPLNEVGWFPAGSTVEKLNNGDFRITPPEGWVYVGKDRNGNLYTVPGGIIEVSCDCTSGSGCDPYVRGAEHCCLMKTGCVECDKKVKVSGIRNGERIEFTVQKGGYINPGAGIYIESENRKLPSAFDEMFEVETVISGVRSFIAESGWTEYDNRTDEYLNFVLHIYGRRGVIRIPKSEIPPFPIPDIRAVVVDGGYSCTCSSGNCKLKKLVVLGTGIIYCESDECRGFCTLKAEGRVDPEYPEAIEATAYRY